MHPVRFKICCIQSAEEAQLAIQYGAHALGLVAAMPSGPGPIEEGRIAEIVRSLPVGVDTVLLTSLSQPEKIARQQQRTGTSSIQLCSPLNEAARVQLAALLPSVKLMQVVHVIGEDSYLNALRAARGSHCLLLDTGSPDARVPVLGGTGRTHDWSISRRIVEECGVPVYLAGGLHRGNVAEAIRTVRPFGVDVCNGVREEMQLVENRLSEYVAEINRVNTEIVAEGR